MQIKGISNTVDSVNYNNSNRNGSNMRRVGTKDIGIEPVKLQREENRYTEEELIKSIESANKQFVAFDRRFEFSIHEKTKQIMVKIIDVTTDEIIREIPPEKILDLVAAIWEISGIIVDERI
ncbi:flagellar protein FlaG [Clostridium sp. Cult2]|uniref:flagellar protein FlaG n=1 Tax=Clostridium sp. Cult2 TaxID=2079003 RepID=UPI001F42E06E|nr:flagellar protein FlaG [Clostridium sp. Cult2]MCF6465251.1 flagellar biosynthesis protein FlaG [Clostridium sp. Cult2]